jgi:hypothetical protein
MVDGTAGGKDAVEVGFAGEAVVATEQGALT